MLESLRTTLKAIQALLDKCVKKINGITPDAEGNVDIGWQKLKDKPFGEEIETFVNNQTFTLIENPSFGAYEGTIEPHVVLVAGRKYTVIYNGVEYNVTAMLHGNASVIVMGNTAKLGGVDTGEPFLILGNNSTSAIVALDGSTKVTLTIIGPNLKQIDAKYIPPVEAMARIFYFTHTASATMYIYKDKSKTEQLTPKELKDCVDNGIPFVLKNTVGGFCYPVYADANNYSGDVYVFIGSSDLERLRV